MKRQSREDAISDLGTDTTRRITDSVDSSLKLSIGEGNSSNHRISSSDKRRQLVRQKLPFNSEKNTLKKFRKAIEPPVRSTRNLRLIRKREKIILTGELQKSESRKNPKECVDLIEFCTYILIRLGTAGCAKNVNLLIKITAMIRNMHLSPKNKYSKR